MMKTKYNTDSKQAIIRAGREMLAATSLSDLSVSRLMKHARVNHGLFHYYFKTKERFYSEVVKDLFDGFNQTAAGSPIQYKNPIEQLRALLIGFALFLRDHWKLLWPVLKDTQLGYLLRRNIEIKMRPHLVALMRTVKECRRKGMLVGESDSEILNRLLVTTVGSVILVRIATEITPDLVKEFPLFKSEQGLDAETLYKRIDMTLRQVSRTKG